MNDTAANLDQCPSSWPRIALGSLCDIIGGFAAPKGEEPFKEGRVPFVRMQDLGRYHRTTNLVKTKDKLNLNYVTKRRLRIIGKGSILIPRSGSVSLNHRAILGIDACIVSHICALALKSSNVDNRYLYYVLCNFDMRKIMRKTTGLDAITFEEVKHIQIPLPPLEIQRNIANALEKADFIKEKRKRANELTDPIIQSVFLKMFGHPAMLRLNYPTKKLGDLAQKRKYAVSSGPFGSNLGTKDYVKSGILVVRGTNIKANEFDASDCKYVSEEKASELKRSQAGPRDLLVIAVGTSGRACIIPDSIQKCIVSQNCNKISLDESLVVPEYVCYLLNTNYFQSQLNTITTDTVRKFLSLTNLARIELPLPPIDNQQRFANVLKRINRLRQIQQYSRNKIDELFESLMNKAFRGELTLQSAETLKS